MFLAVYCSEETIPKFRNDSGVGTINVEEVKLAEPLDWNAFRKRLTYTCPVGFVIERPDGDYSEQPDPIPEEKFKFEAE